MKTENSYPLLPEWMVEIFQNNNAISNIAEVSKDDANGVSMINRKDIIVIDYDKVKEGFNRKLRSNDAFFVMKDENKHGNIVWVEFKNGNLLDANGSLSEDMDSELKEKIYDSISTFLARIYGSSRVETCHIKKNPIKYLREHSLYYLVYNEDKNTDRTELMRHFANLAGERYDGLHGFDSKIKTKFRGYLFKDTIACSAERFERILDDYLNN